MDSHGTPSKVEKERAYNSPFGDENAQGYVYSGHDRIQQQQAEVNEVVGIMKDNVARVLERDQRLSDLDHRADELQVHSREFESISRNIQRKYFWRNMKMWGIIVGVVIVLIIVVIIWATAGHS
ncbi:Synaptobrevin-1 [Taenia crassiceps]|uniref:Synaptobrevin-1 n=1 Tax=Taenia crassiceps TaxID=6207 RepID=A0ABR4QHB2_9CEST